MPRVAACGRSVHGKAAAAGGLRLCYACDRPGSRKWKHMGDSEWWANLGAWSSREGKGWPHERDLQAHKLEVGECICSRADCVAGMYGTFKTRREKEERGSTDRMEIGWSSPMVRYPSTSFQVEGGQPHGRHDGRICRGVPRGRTSPRLVVTSPPYKHAFAILKQALRIGRKGVAFKLRLNFLEPTKGQGRWFTENPPDMVVVLPRAVYRGRTCCAPEAWIVWKKVHGQAEITRPTFCFAVST